MQAELPLPERDNIIVSDSEKLERPILDLSPVPLKRGGRHAGIKPINLEINSRTSTPAESRVTLDLNPPCHPEADVIAQKHRTPASFETNQDPSANSGWVLRHASGAAHSQPSNNNNNIQTDNFHLLPVDSSDVQHQLETQQLDVNQMQRVNEFLAGKKVVEDLRPEDFEKISELGAGNWGVVSRVRHLKTGLIMAKKSIRLDIKLEVQNQIMRELMILHECTSPYIIGYYGAFPSDGTISIYMEYMDGGSLDMVLKHAGRMPEPIVSRILYSVLRGLIYLRRNLSIIHRDVKPSNILMRRNGEIKLCDFGASGKLVNSVAHSFVGSRSYMAPERISGQPYNTSSDVWSLGLSLIELATGRYPIPAIEDENQYFTAFSEDRITNLREHLDAACTGRKLPPVTTPNCGPLSIFDLLVYIVDQPLPRLPSICFSDNFIKLTSSCLCVQHTERPSLDELLVHPFVLTVADACPAGANRRSSIRFSTYDSSDPFTLKDVDGDMADIAFYLANILPPHDAVGSTSGSS